MGHPAWRSPARGAPVVDARGEDLAAGARREVGRVDHLGVLQRRHLQRLAPGTAACMHDGCTHQSQLAHQGLAAPGLVCGGGQTERFVAGARARPGVAHT